MLIVLIAIFILASSSLLFLVVSIVRVRVHVAHLSQTGEGGDYHWNIGNLFNIILMTSALALLPLSFIFSDYNVAFLYSGLIIFGFSIARYQIINVAMKEIVHYRGLHRKEFADEQKWRGMLGRYMQSDLREIFKRESVEEVIAGDSVELRAKILSMDFYNYVASQGIASKEQEFRYLSQCIHQAGNILYDHGCTIVQAVGTGLVALFSNSTLGAIDAAIAVNAHITSTNMQAKDTKVALGALPNYTLLQGLATLGLISNGKVLQSVIVSETLDLAYQVQRLVRGLSIPMVVDEFSKRAHEKLGRYNFRYIGRMENKMSGQIMRTHEVLDVHAEESKERLMAVKDEFEEARRAQEQGEFRKAYSQYTSVLASNPYDLLAQHFRKQCSEIIETENVDAQ